MKKGCPRKEVDTRHTIPNHQWAKFNSNLGSSTALLLFLWSLNGHCSSLQLRYKYFLTSMTWHCNSHEYKCQQYQCHNSNHHHAWLRATLLSSGGWAPFLWMWIQNRQQNHLATPFHQKLFFWDKIVIVTLSGSGNCLKIFLVWAISVRYSAQFFTKINNFIFCLSASGHLQLFIPIHKS